MNKPAPPPKKDDRQRKRDRIPQPVEPITDDEVRRELGFPMLPNTYGDERE